MAAELRTYSPPPSLWLLFEAHTPLYKRDEVKVLLGESLVEQSLELHQEVELLLEIWRDYRHETDHSLEKFMHHRLPEPPDVRERLKKEIQFFVSRIREKSKTKGRDASEVLSKQNQNILQYAMDDIECGTDRCNGRPKTARSSKDGRETPLCSRETSFTDRRYEMEICSLGDKQPADFEMDDVLAHFREVLQTEVSNLLEDIQFLQHCLDEEVDYRCTSSMSREPTLTDLREQRCNLEKELLSEDSGSEMSCLSRQSAVSDELYFHSGNERFSHNTFTDNVPGPSPSHRITSRRKSDVSIASTAVRMPVNSNGSRVSLSGNVLKEDKQKPMKAIHDTDTSASLSIQTLTLEERSISAKDVVRVGSRVRTMSQTRSSQEAHRRRSFDHSPTSPQTVSQSKTALRAVFLNSSPPSHITIRTGAASVKLEKVCSVPVTEVRIMQHNTPTPPTIPRPHGSAQRFRNMVLDCRDCK